MKKFKKIWKYLLGAGAGVILAGAVVGGVVSCSNGNSTQTQPTQQTVNTPTTTKDYTLTPTAQQGVIYNEVLNTIKTPTMIANSTPNYLPQSQLQQQQGLDVYAGGGLSAVITPSEMVKGDTINLTLDLSKDAQGITLAEFEKMGSLIAFEPNNSQTAITLTPDEAGMVEEGTTSPLAVEFNLSNSSTPVYINFPMNGDQLNFTDAYTQLTVNGVNIDLHVDLSPFNGGSTTQSSVSTKNIQFNQQAMDKYLAKGDYSKPFPFTMFTPSNIQNKYVWDGKFNLALPNYTAAVIPLTPNVVDGKVTGWKTPTDTYAYYENGNNYKLQEYIYSFPSTVNWGLATYYATKEIKTLNAELQQLNQYEETIQTLEQTNKNDQSTIQQLGTYLNQASQQLQADEQAQTEANNTLNQANTQIQNDETTIQNLQNELTEDSSLINQLKTLATDEQSPSVMYSDGNNGIQHSLKDAALYTGGGLQYIITVPDPDYYTASGTLYEGSVNSNTANPRPVSYWGNHETVNSWYLSNLRAGTYTFAYQISTTNFTSKIIYVPFTVQWYPANE